MDRNNTVVLLAGSFLYQDLFKEDIFTTVFTVSYVIYDNINNSLGKTYSDSLLMPLLPCC